LWSVYTTTSHVPVADILSIIAIAKDLPGNSEGLVWQMN
jgi:hypothetical protein